MVLAKTLNGTLVSMSDIILDAKQLKCQIFYMGMAAALSKCVDFLFNGGRSSFFLDCLEAIINRGDRQKNNFSSKSECLIKCSAYQFKGLFPPLSHLYHPRNPRQWKSHIFISLFSLRCSSSPRILLPLYYSCHYSHYYYILLLLQLLQLLPQLL